MAKLAVNLDQAPEVVLRSMQLAMAGKATDTGGLWMGRSVNQCIARYFGPISISFELPMHTCTKLQIRFLKAAYGSAKPVPRRWVRYVTQSASFTVRFTDR